MLSLFPHGADMKTIVYAISKNESAFAERWMASMSEADGVYVLDTGSDDGTAEKLAALGAVVKTERITPWRFDVARNRSLDLVPTDADICVCTDLDETFRPGWREALERVWIPGTDRALYDYAWSMTEDGRPGTVFVYDKIHTRFGYRWTHPVHEVLERTDGRAERRVRARGVFLEHRPDKSKSREMYLPLLELSVAECPDDDRNMHYLGREYMFRGRWEDCIRTLRRHLSLPTAVWKDERAASLRFIARSLRMLGRTAEARDGYLLAIAEAPYLREPYTDLAEMLLSSGEMYGAAYFARCALAITQRPETYICEEKAWGSMPHDILSVALYYTGDVRASLEEAEKALLFEPDNERLARNVRLIRAAASSASEKGK